MDGVIPSMPLRWRPWSSQQRSPAFILTMRFGSRKSSWWSSFLEHGGMRKSTCSKIPSYTSPIFSSRLSSP
eukprot:3979771-Prymnesium_polylepis.1